MIEFKNAPPKWGVAGEEPTAEAIASGYNAGDKIPAPYHNFYLHRTGECIEELQSKLSNENTDRVNSETGINNDITAHKNNKTNPHGVTKEQIGLDKVDNTPDSEKNVAFASETSNARKVANALTVRVNGGSSEGVDKWTFDGSTSKSINFTLDKIGARPKNKPNIVVNAVREETADGKETYVVSDSNITELYNGLEITIIPNEKNTTSSPRLKINDFGDNGIRLPLSFNVAATTTIEANYFQADRPITLKYHSELNLGIQGQGAWLFADRIKTSAQDLYGNVPIDSGGTGADTAEEALNNLGAVGRKTEQNGEIFNDYQNNKATEYAHAEGQKTQANAIGSHTEGYGTVANGAYSHATGYCTGAGGNYQAVFGKYNVGYGSGEVEDTSGSIFIVGVGTSETAKANAFRITNAGKCMGSQSFAASGADYAEYFEWIDGNPNKEDRRGYFVTLDGIKIRKANAEDDYILGVISATPSIVGNAFTDMWHGMYLTDIYGERLTEVVDVLETKDEETGRVIPAHKETRFVLNPDYDPTEKYVGRDERKEWSLVGTHGQLVVVDDGSCEVNGYCKVADGGKAVKSTEKTEYRVIERLDDTHIRIYIK